MAWTAAQRAQLRTELLLRYVALNLPAEAAALLRPRSEASLLLVARTELWPPSGLDHVERVWRYSRRRLLEGAIERHRRIAVIPLFETGVPQLQALLAVSDLAEGYQPTDDHRQLFARLLGEATAATATLPRWEPGAQPTAEPNVADVLGLSGRDALEQAQRERIEDALAGQHGNVAAAARELHVPYRTLKDRIKRFRVDVSAFRVRQT